MNLPKLRKSTTQVEQLLSYDKISPKQVNYELRRIPMSVKSLKNAIDDVQKQIPPNLDLYLADMTNDVNILSMDSSTITEQDIIQSSIGKMKRKVLLRAGNHKNSNAIELTNRLTSILNGNSSIENENSAENVFRRELSETEKQLEILERKANKSLVDIERAIADRTTQNQGSQRKKELRKSLDDAMSIKSAAVSYKSKVNSLNVQMMQLNITDVGSSVQSSTISPRADPLMDLPDLDVKLNELSEEIYKSQDSQLSVIEKAESDVEECEKRIAVNEKEVEDLHSTTMTLVASVNEIEGRVKELMEKVSKEMVSRADNKEEYNIKALYAKFSAQKSVAMNELKCLSERLKQASFDIPMTAKLQSFPNHA